MLSNLHIENIAVIEKADVDFSNGFNVLTGETGAGKSIIIDAINAILGKRISKDIVRSGCSKGFVSALFTDLNAETINRLHELGYCDDVNDFDALLIQRSVSLDGKNIFKINTRPATASIFKEIGNYLIDIHGQNDNQFLLTSSNYYKYLDKLAENNTIYDNFIIQYEKYKNLYKQRRNLSLSEDEKKSRINYLSEIIDELGKSKIQIGEKEELTKQLVIINNAEKIINSVNYADSLLNGNNDQIGAVSLIDSVINDLNNISKFNIEFNPIIDRIKSAYLEIDESIKELNSIAINTKFDHNQAQQIEERLDLIYKLTKKYSISADELPKLLENSIDELNKITGIENNIDKLDEILEIEKQNTIKLAFELSESRKNAAKKFESVVIEELKFLDMPYAKFEVVFKTKSLDNIGLDDIDFYISVNPGEDLRPLSETASGGELSRIMLSIKNIISQYDIVDTMIFDEIDTGTSGKAASNIGSKLKNISSKKQVICITHLAQIACLADNHLLVKKSVSEGRTNTVVNSLTNNERCYEIARIIGGESLTENTLKTAKEMLGLNVDN